MSKKEYIKRYIWFFIGLYILSMGIALSTKANLGVSPVSSIPYVLSLALPVTLGQITIVVQLIYILCQVLILRKKFRITAFFQILIVIIYGYFNDLSMMILNQVEPTNYVMQWAFCIGSMFLIAFGVNMEVKAGVMMLAVDKLMVIISEEFHIDFGKVKIAFDCSQVGIAVVFSLIMMHRLEGVREGTVAAAIFVGLIIKLYNKKIGGLYRAIGLTPAQVETTSAPVQQPTQLPHIITIAREVGSGGHEIGQLLGEKMHLPVYDKDMIELVAKESGLDSKLVEKKEQSMISSFFETLYEQTFQTVPNKESTADSIKNAQERIVKNIASTQPCIIVGRLGNYFLKDQPNCFHVFVHAAESYRIEHFKNENKIDEAAAKREVARRNQERKNHYRFYTGREYGNSNDYHLCVDSTVLGSEKAAQMIMQAAEIYFG